MMKFVDSENRQVQQPKSKTKEVAPSKMQVFPKFCIDCGSPLELGDIFCSECGSKIQEEEFALFSPPTPKAKSIFNSLHVGVSGILSFPLSP